MSRRNTPAKRIVPLDSRYNSKTITMLINRMMYGGKRSVAQRIVYDALALVEERAKKDPMEIFDQAIRNVTPTVEVKPRRVGGSTYQVPVEVAPARASSLALRWLIQYARARGGRGMANRLAAELMDAASGQGAAVKKKDDTHRMAEANRAFAHFR
jgi:small subunit ribosomal protein S7